MLHGTATWPGLRSGVISFSYTCSHGSGAGVATLVVQMQDLTAIAPEGDLTFSDGVNGPITLRDCRLDSTNIVEVSGGRAVALHILDRRWAWRFGGVSGYYNQRDPFPDPRIENDIKFQLWVFQNIDKRLHGQIDFTQFTARPGQSEYLPGTERTPKQLMLTCLSAMRENPAGVQFGPIPDDARPPVDWNGVNPAQALQSVADAAACRLIFQPCRDGVLVGPLATPDDAFTLPNLPTIADHPGVNPPDAPDTIVLLGGPVLVSDFWKLQAVGFEADGSVRPIEKLSYAPAAGWWGQLPGHTHWYDVRVGDSPDLDTSKALAKQFVWRTFRLVGAPALVKRDPPNLAEGVGAGGDYEAYVQQKAEEERFKQPVVEFPDLAHPRQIELLDVEYDIDKDRFGQLKSKPAKLWADSFKRFGNVQMLGLNRQFPEELDVSFSMDARGLITTDQPIFKVQKIGTNGVWKEVRMADVYVRCSAKIRHPQTWQVIPGQWELRSGGNRPRVPPEVIQHPELQPVFVTQRNPRRNFRVTLQEDNVPDVTRAARYYLLAHAEKYKTIQSTTREYAGLYPLDPDRAIQQVSWSFGVGQRPTTTIGVGTEHNPYVPSYPERRRIDALASFISENWVNQVLGRWQDGSNK